MRSLSIILAMLSPAILLGLGCNDRTTDPAPIRYIPPSSDAGSDVEGPTAPDVTTRRDPQCDGLFDGASCDLPNAGGICAAGACRLVACDFGRGDCDEDPTTGCETDLREPEHCGACTVTCEEAQTCQEGRGGFVCATEIVCPEGRYDLDRDRTNGCEWRSSWASGSPLVPPSLRVDTGSRVVGEGETYWALAGTDDDQQRVFTTTERVAGPHAFTATPAADEQTAAVGMTAAGPEVLVAWSDGLSYFARDEGMDWFATLDCEPVGERTRRFHDVVTVGETSVAISSHEIAVLGFGEDCEADEFCVTNTLGPADYLRAFSPHPAGTPLPGADPRWQFDAEELASCDPCLIDQATGEFAVDAACLGAEQCRVDFDPAGCGTCMPAASSCPDFSPRAAAASPDGTLLYVATARGLVILDASSDELEWLARVEDTFATGSASGTEWIRVAAEPSRVSILRNDGLIRTFEVADPVGLRAAAPSLQVGVDLARPPFTAASSDVLVVGGPRTGTLVEPQPASATSAVLGLEQAPPITGLELTLVAGSPDPATAHLLYQAAGQVFERTVSRDADIAGSGTP